MAELWPFIPLANFSESLEWLTEVMISRTLEQRIALRSAPRQILSYGYLLDFNQFMWAKSFAQRNASLTVTVPVWFDAVRTNNIHDAQTVLVLDTRYSDFRVGEQLVIFENWEKAVAHNIVAMTDNDITIEDPAGLNFYRPYVIPARECFFVQGMQITRGPIVNRVFVRFQSINNTDFNESSLETYPTYNSLDVLTDAPQVRNEISESIIHPVEFIDNGFGLVNLETTKDTVDYGRAISFVDSFGEELWNRRRWLHYRRGKQKPFWFPSFSDDLILNADITSGQTLFSVKSIGPAEFYIGKHLAIILKNGTRYFREITDALAFDEDNDDITLSSSLGANISRSNIAFVSFMNKVRLNSDVVSIEQITPGKVNIVLPIIEVVE